MLHKYDPYLDFCIQAVNNHVRDFIKIARTALNVWSGYRNAIIFAPDHGAHIDSESGHGDHGMDIPEDMQLFHWYGINSAKIKFLRFDMKLPIFQVDAFTNKIFSGNPAAVCPLEQWLPDDIMQQIAAENSVAETAFFISLNDSFKIRWFTPEIEMDLCGHATLAAAHVIAKHLNSPFTSLKFHSKSGILTVTVENELLTMDFPSRKPEADDLPQEISDAIQPKPIEVLKSRDYVLVFETEEIIRSIKPDQNILNQINLDPGGIIVTARGNEVDFVPASSLRKQAFLKIRSQALPIAH